MYDHEWFIQCLIIYARVEMTLSCLQIKKILSMPTCLRNLFPDGTINATGTIKALPKIFWSFSWKKLWSQIHGLFGPWFFDLVSHQILCACWTSFPCHKPSVFWSRTIFCVKFVGERRRLGSIMKKMLQMFRNSIIIQFHNNYNFVDHVRE